jgi:hypothetical protein
MRVKKMKGMIHFEEIKDKRIAEVIDKNLVISNTDEALDLMANLSYKGCSRIIIYEENLHPDFFKLRTLLAGDILQKVSNYMMKLAIIYDQAKYSSKSLRDFVYECNKGRQVFFVKDREEALARLSSV